MEYSWSTFSNLELSRLLNNGAGVEVLDTNFKRAFLGEVARRIESAARLESELAAARAAAGIEAGEPLDEWIKALVQDRDELRHKLNDAMRIGRGFVAERDEARRENERLNEVVRGLSKRLSEVTP